MSMSNVSGLTDAVAVNFSRRWFNAPVLRIPVLFLLFSAAAAEEAVHSSALLNFDVWWHICTGLWILQNHAVPHVGLFSQYSNLPWIDSSWGFQVLIAVMYKLVWLRAPTIMMMGFKAAFAVVTFLLARGWRGNFWTAVGLSAVAQYAIADPQPDPICFSVLCFGVELILLLQCRRSGSARPLFWLPVLFLFWANLHAEYVDGLLLFALFLLTLSVERMLGRFSVKWVQSQPAPRLTTVGVVAGISFFATFVTPYPRHLFGNVLKDVYGDTSFKYFSEFHSMTFREPQHYVVLLLVMVSFFALARQHSRDLFKLSLLVLGAVIAFRIQRDVWCAVLPSIAVLGDSLPVDQGQATREATFWKREKPVTVILLVATFMIAASRVPASNNELMNKVSARFPVKACDFIRGAHLSQPLFNPYAWGGFLIWYMPEYPVSIDGRMASLYGNELVTRHYKTMSGNEVLEDDPSFVNAGTILLERQSGIARALTTIPRLSSRYRVRYSDDLAIVLEPR